MSKRRIVDYFYTFDELKDSLLDTELVGTLKDIEMYANIHGKRTMDAQQVDIVKHWIYHLSDTKQYTDDQKITRNQQAKELLETIRRYIILSLPIKMNIS